MIAKICVHDKTRESAIEKMQSVLEKTVIAGVVNNLSFLQSIFYNNDFLQGNIDTNFIQNHYPDGFGYNIINNDFLYNILCTCLYKYCLFYISDINSQKLEEQKLIANINNHEYCIQAKFEKNNLEFKLGNKKFKVESNWNINEILFIGKLNGEKFFSRIFTKNEIEDIVEYKGIIAKCTILPYEIAKLHKIVKNNKNQQLKSDRVLSQITGMILNIYVKPGDEVKKGDPLFVIEAMKMQNTFSSERNGMIKEILVNSKTNINEGDLILEFFKDKT
jgi:propionyl-CoA carboxylase alpha chain